MRRLRFDTIAFFSAAAAAAIAAGTATGLALQTQPAASRTDLPAPSVGAERSGVRGGGANANSSVLPTLPDEGDLRDDALEDVAGEIERARDIDRPNPTRPSRPGTNPGTGQPPTGGRDDAEDDADEAREDADEREEDAREDADEAEEEARDNAAKREAEARRDAERREQQARNQAPPRP